LGLPVSPKRRGAEKRISFSALIVINSTHTHTNAELTEKCRR
jgi:hypothetical protein